MENVLVKENEKPVSAATWYKIRNKKKPLVDNYPIPEAGTYIRMIKRQFEPQFRVPREMWDECFYVEKITEHLVVLRKAINDVIFNQCFQINEFRQGYCVFTYIDSMNSELKNLKAN